MWRIKGNFYLAHMSLHQLINGTVEGGREQHCLSRMVIANSAKDVVHLFLETHFSHPISFIQNQMGDFCQTDDSCLTEINEAARAGCQYVHRFAKESIHLELPVFTTSISNFDVQWPSQR